MAFRRMLVIQVAGLGYDFIVRHGATSVGRMTFKPLTPVFPAVTCTAQASFRTASWPQHHGMIANGLYLNNLRRPLFWEQSSALVEGPRLWEHWREKGRTVGMIAWQQSLGESIDLILSPAPIHKHGGGMVDAWYAQPENLYDRVCDQIGKKFHLHHYWGPLASVKSADWIARATTAVMADPGYAPDLLLTYLPTLDYDLQRYGPHDPHARKALSVLMQEMTLLLDGATRCGYEVVIFGDYAIASCDGHVCYPNRLLREQKLLAVRSVRGQLYPDFHTSKAFAVVDHEVAHLYLHPSVNRADLSKLLASYPGIGEVIEGADLQKIALAHQRTGDIVIVAKPGAWFAYPWWIKRAEAPDYDAHVDIHNKPGYDPAELFLGWPPMTVSRDFSRIRGTHGAVGEGREAAWAATCELEMASERPHLIDLASAVKRWLDSHS